MEGNAKRGLKGEKEDLLKLHFSNNDPNQRNKESSSSSLSYDDSAPLQTRIPFDFRQRRTNLHGKQMENTTNLNNSKKNITDPEQKSIDRQIIVNEIPNGPRFESSIRSPIERVRKSSFFELEENFSWSDQTHDPHSNSNQLLENYIEKNSLQLDQIQEKTQGAKTPHFNIDDLNDEDLIITEFLGVQSKKKTKSTPNKSISQEHQISFGKSQSQSQIKSKTFEAEEIRSKLEIQSKERQAEKYQVEKNNIYRKEVICFKCGRNHYSNQCTEEESNQKSSDIKCFNCKRNGHTARNCLEQRRCNNCSSTDHISRDCPTIQSSRQRKVCINCNQMGHFAKECTKPLKCFLCHQVGHQIRNCPKNKQNNRNREIDRILQPRLCFNCKKQGHYAPDCPEPSRCHKCGQQGHYSRDCPHYGMRPMSFDASSNSQEKIERNQSEEKPASEPEVRKNKPFLKINFKKKSVSKKISEKKGRKNESKEKGNSRKK